MHRLALIRCVKVSLGIIQAKNILIYSVAWGKCYITSFCDVFHLPLTLQVYPFPARLFGKKLLTINKFLMLSSRNALVGHIWQSQPWRSIIYKSRKKYFCTKLLEKRKYATLEKSLSTIEIVYNWEYYSYIWDRQKPVHVQGWILSAWITHIPHFS